eukprot:g2324.t1
MCWIWEGVCAGDVITGGKEWCNLMDGVCDQCNVDCSNIPEAHGRADCLSSCRQDGCDTGSDLTFINMIDSSGHASIPEGTEKVPINAFKGCSALKKVTLPSTLVSPQDASYDAIGEKAFWGCTNLAEVSFGSSTRTITIGEYAFKRTGLTSVTLPRFLKIDLGKGAFEECALLQTVTFGSWSTSGYLNIGMDAFRNCVVLARVCGLNANGNVENQGCKDCPVGYFQPEENHVNCTRCACGFSSDAGSTTCYRGCADGKYPNLNCDSDGNPCLSCPPGHSCEGGTKVPCAVGNYQDEENKVVCKPCSSGTFGNQDIARNSSVHCQECPKGKLQQSSGRSSCEDKPSGDTLLSTYTVATSVTTQPALEDTSQVRTAFEDALMDSIGVRRESVTITSLSGSTVAFAVDFRCGVNAPSDLGQCRGNATAASVTLKNNVTLLSAVQQAMRAQSLVVPSSLVVGNTVLAVAQEMLNCLSTGVDCSGIELRYKGDVWHHPRISVPNCTTVNGTSLCTRMYTCVNKGCPEAGATEMKCRDGYKDDSPLCALCAEGYFMQMRDCHECGDSVRIGAFFGVLATMIFVLLLLCRLVLRYWRLLARSTTMSHMKILISFIVVLTSVDVQFGVTWPSAFAWALDAMSIFSFDLSVMGGILCHYDFSFYDLLFGSTTLLVGMVLVIWAVYFCLRWLRDDDRHRRKGLYHGAVYAAVYLCLFAYPVISVRAVDTFGCHEVEGTYYLRADYSVECY